jgi:hypothetical protein
MTASGTFKDILFRSIGDLSTLFGTKNSHNPQIFYATFDFSLSHHLISASIGESKLPSNAYGKFFTNFISH